MNKLSNVYVPAALGPFAILWAHASGKLKDNSLLKRELGFFLLLQVFSLGLAVISGWLGYTRALTFFSGVANKHLAALCMTIFIAGSAYFLVNHCTSRIAFRLQGGRLIGGQMMALFLSLLLSTGVIALDIFLNLSGVEPASYILTEDAKQSGATSIIEQYDVQITDAQGRLQDIERKYFTWKGKVYVPSKPTKWHTQSQIDEYQQTKTEVLTLQQTKTQALQNDSKAVSIDSDRFLDERGAKVDALTLLVILMYVLMAISTTRAALYANLVLDYLDSNPYGDIPGTQEDRYGKHGYPTSRNRNEQSTPIGFQQNRSADDYANLLQEVQELRDQLESQTAKKSPGESGSQSTVNTHQTEIDLGPSHPEFTTLVQPDRYRGVDPVKYKRFLQIAEQVAIERGRYVKSVIATRTGIARDTVNTYLKAALEQNHLSA